MSIRKTLYILGLLLTLALVLPVVHADEANQAVKVTFSQPVQIPGRTLPAGTYWFERVGVNDPNILRVFNADHSALLAVLFSAPTERREAASHTTFIFANQGAGKAEAMVKWFYPGETLGYELLYAKPTSQQLARDMKETVVAGD